MTYVWTNPCCCASCGPWSQDGWVNSHLMRSSAGGEANNPELEATVPSVRSCHLQKHLQDKKTANIKVCRSPSAQTHKFNHVPHTLACLTCRFRLNGGHSTHIPEQICRRKVANLPILPGGGYKPLKGRDYPEIPWIPPLYSQHQTLNHHSCWVM